MTETDLDLFSDDELIGCFDLQLYPKPVASLHPAPEQEIIGASMF